MTNDVWQDLLIYQSGDLIRSLYRKRKHRSLGQGAAREIRAHFVQGANYFHAAKGVADIIKPLILYYGCLALSRGTILFLRDKREATLTQSHGLGAVRWTHVLSSGSQHLIDLSVKLDQSGTFIDLAAATGNRNYFRFGVDRNFKQTYSCNALTGKSSTCRDLLSRIPRLKDIYEAVLSQASNCIYGELLYIYAHGNPAGDFSFRITSHHRKRLFDVEGTLGRLRNLCGISIVHDDEEKFEIRWPAEDDQHELAPVPVATRPDSPGFAEFRLVVLPFEDGPYLSQLLTCFALAYVLGTIVRYHPSAWMGVLHKGCNDEMLPLIRAAVDHVEQDFPKFILNSLTEHPNF